MNKIGSKEFIKLVRETPESYNMDHELVRIFNENISAHIENTIFKCGVRQKRLFDFVKKQNAKFWVEYNSIRETVTKLGYFGQWLDEVAMHIYVNELDPEPYVKNIIAKKLERQKNYANMPKQVKDNSSEQTFL